MRGIEKFRKSERAKINAMARGRKCETKEKEKNNKIMSAETIHFVRFGFSACYHLKGKT